MSTSIDFGALLKSLALLLVACLITVFFMGLEAGLLIWIIIFVAFCFAPQWLKNLN